MTAYTAEQKHKAIERELSYRRRVFPRLVSQGKMTASASAEQIALFEAIGADYARQAAAAKPDLFGTPPAKPRAYVD
jgi:hypothetical protein